MSTISVWWMWLAFFILIAIVLYIDLFCLGGRKSHRVSSKEALFWSLAWFGLAILFNLFLWLYLVHTASYTIANQKALEFFTGYLIEKSLSVDNIFVILMIFNYFAIPKEYQHKILIYGVLGAIVMRLILIVLGIWVVNQFSWILYIFGLFLLVTGIKMFLTSEKKSNLAKNPLLKFLNTRLRVTHELHEDRLLIRRNKLIYVTPLFIVVILIEVSDLIFAVDSIPAIFAITKDPFIVFTSNIFAILGLRALYFLLANMSERFQFLKYGLAIILIFVGIKMLIVEWVKIPAYIALSVIVLTLTICILLSIHRSAKSKNAG